MPPDLSAFQDDRPNLPPAPNVAITPAGDLWPRPYYFENGLRRVAPYHYTYQTYCKGRWRDRGILDIFAQEFRDRSREYYKEAIEAGRIVLNGAICEDIETKVKNGDVISHTLHRHEPPVSAQPIRAIHEDEGMIVIDKPAGIPVHPAGRYKFNTIVEIMRAERSQAFNPLPCNRLDRLTSGVMFIGKTGKKAEEISKKLRSRTVRKEYVARVKGKFPDGELLASETKDETGQRGGVVKCEEPILQISPVLGLNRARASGKHAKTLFRRISYRPGSPNATEDEGHSIVHCLPLTGRTHQIRVHLQFLGFPISNDPIYSNRAVFGASLGKGDNLADDDEVIKERLNRMGKTELADAYGYTIGPAQSAETAESVQTKQGSDQITIDLSTLNLSNETQQITPTRLAQLEQRNLERARLLHEKYGPTADYKPLHHGTLHASSSLGDLGTDKDGHVSTNGVQDVSDPSYRALLESHDEMVQDYNKRKGEKLTGEICSSCQTPLYSDPGEHELGIYLHALAYADVHGEWRYTSPMPDWTADSDTGVVPPPPAWDYEALGEEGTVDVEEEKRESKRRNHRAMLENRELLH